MPVSVDPVTHVIFVPQSYLTFVSGSIYDLDTAALRADLRAWEASEAGRTQPITHIHYPAYTIAGVTNSGAYRLTQDYSLEIEDGNISVRLQGMNNNLFDIADGRLVKNNVLIIPNNSAGLQTVASGSGLDAGQDAKITSIDAAVQLLQNLTEADEVHTSAAIIKKLRGTETELLRKSVTGSSLTGTLTVADP